jgi:hypothetical protein
VLFQMLGNIVSRVVRKPSTYLELKKLNFCTRILIFVHVLRFKYAVRVKRESKHVRTTRPTAQEQTMFRTETCNLSASISPTLVYLVALKPRPWDGVCLETRPFQYVDSGSLAPCGQRTSPALPYSLLQPRPFSFCAPH